MSDTSPSPPPQSSDTAVLRGVLTTALTLVTCAFLLSSLYTTYIHCGVRGAGVQHVLWWLPSSVTVTIYPQATSLGIFLRGDGLLPKPRPSLRVVECALLYLLNKACSLLPAASHAHPSGHAAAVTARGTWSFWGETREVAGSSGPLFP